MNRLPYCCSVSYVLTHGSLGQIQMLGSAGEIPKIGKHCEGSEPLRVNHHEVLS